MRLILFLALGLGLVCYVPSMASGQVYVNTESDLQAAINAGDTTIDLSGNITITSALSLSTNASSVIVNGDGYTLSGGGGLTVNDSSGSSVTFALSGSNSLGQIIQSGGYLSMSGEDVATLLFIHGGNVTFSGMETINGPVSIGQTSGDNGSLTISGGTLTVGGGNIFTLGDNGGSVGGNASGTIYQTGGTVNLGSSLDPVVYGSVGVAGTGEYELSSGATLNVYASGGFNISDRPGSTGQIDVSGTMNVVGGLFVTKSTGGLGTLNIDSGGIVNTDALTFGGGTFGDSGSTGIVNLNSGGVLTTGSIQTMNSPMAEINFLGGTFKSSSAFTIPSTVTLTVDDGGAILDASGGTLTSNAGFLAGTGSGGLTVTGSGMVILAGANTYGGLTAVQGGLLQIGNGTSGSINSSSGVVVSTGSIFAIDEADGSTFSADISNSGTVSGAEGPGITNTISGTISGPGGFTQTGAGTTELAGGNTYTGITTLAAGTLVLGSVENRGTSGPMGKSAANNPGSIVFNGGTLEYSSVNTVDYSGRFSTTADQQYNINVNGQTVTFGTPLTSSGGALNLNSAPNLFGHLILTGTSTYTGGTVINGYADLQLGNGSLNGLAGTGGIDVNVGYVVYDENSAVIESNAISGNGGVIQEGPGKVTLTGNNTYAQNTLVQGGTLAVSGSGTLGLSATLGMEGGTLDLGGTNQTTGYVNITFAASSGDTIQNGTLTAPGYHGYNNSGNAVISANLAGSSSQLYESGYGGTMTLTGNNTYGGGTYVQAGTLTLSGAGTLGAATGTLEVDNENSGIGDAVVLNLSSTNPTTTGSLSGLITAPSSGTNNAIIYNGGQLFTVNQTTAGTFAGTIAGTGGFTLGSGSTSTLTFTGANTYSGDTTIAAGTLALNGSGTMGTSGNLYLDGGTLNLGGTNQTTGNVFIVDGASSGNTIQNGTLTAPDFYYEASGNATISANLAGASNFFQQGLGTVTLSGNNTYSGATEIESGTLVINGSGTLGSSASLYMYGGTLDLGATNQITGDVYIYNAAGSGNTIQNGTLNAPAYYGYNNGNAILSANLAGSSSSFTEAGSGSVTFIGTKTYGGVTTINSGTLILGSSVAPSTISGTSSVLINNSGSLLFGNNSSINSSTPIKINGGGTIGFTSGSTPITAIAGALTLQSGTAIIDFGSGSRNNTLTFTSLLNLAGAATINVFNWSNTSGNTYGTGGNSTTDSASNRAQDHLVLSGGAGMEAAALNDINFYSGSTTSSEFLGSGEEVAFGSSGAVEIVPTPEPSTIFIGVCLMGLVTFRPQVYFLPIKRFINSFCESTPKCL